MANDILPFLTKDEQAQWQGTPVFSSDAMGRIMAPRLITEAFQRLLEQKHLYQSVRVHEHEDFDKAVTYWGAMKPSVGGGAGAGPRAVIPVQSLPTPTDLEKKARDGFETQLSQPWNSAIPGFPGRPGLPFSQPKPVLAYCPSCQDRVAFNPTERAGKELPIVWTIQGKDSSEQHFVFCYECQHCREGQRERIVFLIMRVGNKITLCGRDPLEAVVMEKFIPKKPAKYLSNAIVAQQAGQSLAGNFLLRTFIEQFWRTIPQVEDARKASLQAGKRMTGDELGELYGASLPLGFKEQFPSLKQAYATLSEAVHEAREGEDATKIFTAAVRDINEHFDARRLFKM